MKTIKLLLIIILFHSCTKIPEPQTGSGNKVVIVTNSISSITANSASGSGNITTDGGSTISQRGLCWSINSGPTVSDSKSISGTGIGSFNINLTGLNPVTKYYVRSFAINSIGTFYGNEITFTTIATIPGITTKPLSLITSTTANSGGIINSDGGSAITQRGICWSTNPGPTTFDNKTVDSALNSFNSKLISLTPNIQYYVRAYAVNSIGTAYGQEVSFKSLSTLPIVSSTNSVTSITQNTAISGGSITSDGGTLITERGLCWSTNSSPTILNNKVSSGSGIGNFNAQLNGLLPNIQYYVRAYAINSVGVSYGPEVTFITSPGLPSLTTVSVTSITQNTANSGGSISSDGGSTIIQKGVCWSTISGPTISNSKTFDGSGSNSFTTLISGLSSNTNYYVRAYATNSIGTAYGNEIVIKTLASLPTLTTLSVSSIGQTSANSGGIIGSDGGSTVTQKGVCWSISSTPTIADNKTNDGSGSGSFNSLLSGLASNTSYYLRAYATNSAGTAYGNLISFTTLGSPPTISTNSITSISETAAISGGVISSDGGNAITQKGVCWSTSSSPNINNNITNNGSGSTSFTSTLTNLTPGTTYYLRSYALNANGTSYGVERAFSTLPLATTTLVTPLAGASFLNSNNYNFSWNSVIGATSYEINISKSVSFAGSFNNISTCTLGVSPSNTLVNSTTVNSTTFCMRIGLSSNNGTWYWRVRAINGSYLGPWSVTRSFTFTF